LRPAEDFFLRYPHELSGGQRQRVVIAGAMVLQPELLIADEPVSMLDVSIRADILNLLRDLRKTRGISILFITHDLGTVAYFADRIAVMYLGRIVETGPTREVLGHPQHPYTRALLSVIPVPNPRLRRERIILQGETPNPLDVPSGCRFHPRCPVAIDKCREVDPPYAQVHSQHSVACLLVAPPGAPQV
jgi:oligopeptide/dipeptide ABC transporter ATP-binding protein